MFARDRQTVQSQSMCIMTDRARRVWKTVDLFANFSMPASCSLLSKAKVE